MNPIEQSESSWDSVVREEAVKEFKQEYGARLDELWAVLRGDKIDCLASGWTKDDVAFSVSELVELQRNRYDKPSFQHRLRHLKSSGLPIHSDLSYFESIDHGILAAESISTNCLTLISSLAALDINHIIVFMTTLDQVLNRSKISVFRGDYKNLLQTLYHFKSGMEACKVALMLSTGRNAETRKRGRPPSRYQQAAMEAAVLWEEITNKPVVTPKGHKGAGRHAEAAQASTHFIHLVLQIAKPGIAIKETMTAIRHVLTTFKLMQNSQATEGKSFAQRISRFTKQMDKLSTPRRKLP